MLSQDAVLVDLADEACFLPIVRPSMDVILHAVREVDRAPDRVDGQDAIEVDPLAAVVRPGGAAEGLADPGRGDGILQLDQVFADHILVSR